MNFFQYSKGLHNLGNGVYAYLQPDGSWGLSNAGLIVDNGQSMVIDTLFDLKLTSEMLDEMKKSEPAAESVNFLINTHANGDHCFGNELCEGAKIIASKACSLEMAEMPPMLLHQMIQFASQMGEIGKYLLHCFSAFDFSNINLTLPNSIFEGKLDINVGNKSIQLIEVGPAHTKGDIIVYEPCSKTVFAGDMLFIGGTPIMWQGPVKNWIKACDLMIGLNPDYIVPGHGPITDIDGVKQVKSYFEYITDEAKKRFDKGMSPEEACIDIDLKEFAAWGDWERVGVNISTLYNEFSNNSAEPNNIALFELMATLKNKKNS